MLTKDALRQAANILAIPLGILANYLPLGGAGDVGTVARRNEPLLAAAGWAFAIWGLIFAGQLAYAVYQSLATQRRRPLHRRIGWLTALNGVLGGAWTVSFTHEQFVLSWILMLALLVNLVFIEVRLHEDARAGVDLWLVRIPFTVNLGWISVATILNTSQFLHGVIGYEGAPLSPLAWSFILVFIAAALAIVMAIIRRELAFALTVAWGLAGIGAYRVSEYSMLGIASFILAGVLSLMVLVEAIGLQRGWFPILASPHHGRAHHH